MTGRDISGIYFHCKRTIVRRTEPAYYGLVAKIIVISISREFTICIATPQIA